MTTDFHISLIFVNYHSSWQTSLALESLFSFEKSDLFQVIVVNNDPKERLVMEELQRLYPFTLVQNEENLGFGKAANQGARLAEGHLLGFINPDTLWQRKSLSEIEAYFRENTSVGILGMTLLDKNDSKEMWSSGSFPTIFELIKNNVVPSLAHQKNSIGNTKPDWVSGGGLFIRKNLFTELSGFDEEFFLYFEDVDLCFRTREKKFTVAREDRYALAHSGGKSQVSKQKQKTHFYRSQEKYFEKHRPFYESMFLRFLHAIFC